MLMYPITKYRGLFILLLGCFLFQPEVHGQKIVIVGGGVSGLSAAYHLCRNGLCDVTVLEAEDRVGGRLYTDRFHDEIIERGAQWMHGIRGNPVYWLISRNHTVSVDNFLARGILKFSSNTTSNEEIMQLLYMAYGLWDEASEKINALADRSSLKKMSILEEGRIMWDSKLNSNNITLNKTITDAIFHYIMTGWSVELGAKAQDAGALSFAYYRYLHGGDIAIPQGYSVLLDILQKGFPKSAIKTGNEVTKIIWDKTGNEEASNSNNSQIIVEYTDKDRGLERINADHVIVTVSIGVLQKLHRSMIVPNMPRQKIRAVEKLQLGTVNKIFLYYENEFWEDGKFPLHIFWDSEIQKDFEEDGHWYKEIGLFQNPKENMLLVWANAYISRHILNHTNEEIGRLFTILLRKIMNDNSIPLPDDILVTI